jgi:hypothetical protein
MSFFGKKKTRASQSILLRPRRSRIFRGAVRENVDGATERKYSLWTACYAFLWIAFCGAIVFVLFFSSFLRIDRKVVNPLHSVPNNAVSSVIDTFLSGTSFGIVPNDTIPVAFLRRRVLEWDLRETFPIFRSVHVSFVFPETLVLLSEERKTTLVLCSGGPCFLIDERGVAFDEAPAPIDTRDADAMLVVIDQSAKPILFQDPIFSEDFLEMFPPLRRKLSDELGILASNSAETPSRLSNELWFRTREGWELRLSATVPSEKAFLALRLLFDKTLSESDRKNLEYIDLRTENRIFYLLKGGEKKEGEKAEDDEKKGERKKK